VHHPHFPFWACDGENGGADDLPQAAHEKASVQEINVRKMKDAETERWAEEMRECDSGGYGNVDMTAGVG
jgi:hypothetical protein